MVQVLPKVETFGERLGTALGGALGNIGVGYVDRQQKKTAREKLQDNSLTPQERAKYMAVLTKEEQQALRDERQLSGLQRLQEQLQQNPNMSSQEMALGLASVDPKLSMKAFSPIIREKARSEQPLSSEKLFTGLVKKTLGSHPSKDAVKKAEKIFAHGGELMKQGLDPLQAFNQAVESFGQENPDVAKVRKLKKTKILSDDEIASALITKGYSPLELRDQFGLEMSDELLDQMSEQAQPPQAQPQRMRWNPQDPAHQQRAMQILQQVGDRAKANQILQQEFER